MTVAELRLTLKELEKGIALATGERHRITIVRGVSRLRLVGMFFDLNKCFLLPSAMRGIRGIKARYDEHPNSNLLIVGHTDTSGQDAYNSTLSLERADALAAYLTDAVPAWEAFFGDDKPDEKRWGTLEIQHMLTKLPQGQPPFYEGKPNGIKDAKHKAAVTRFQEAKGLEADGIAGPITRQALIKDYMGIDGTTLPAGITPTTHGCGENFPVDATGDGVRDPDNRRVEVFFFAGPITPPPPGKTSARGSTEYPQWLAQVTETVDFSAEKAEDDTLLIRLHDENAKPMTEVPFRVTISGTPPVSGISPDGFVTLALPPFCPESITVDWGGPRDDGQLLFNRDIVVECQQGTDKQQSVAKLTNLGYPSETDPEFDAAVRAFQHDYQVEEVGLLNGLPPPITRAKMESIYVLNLDATRPKGEGAAAKEEEDGEPPPVTLTMECAL
jgi:peptidoglycan hydrolase-like protein with peptidoglycan-binding domain